MRISYSGIDTYKNCPLKYKYREIDKIPEPKGKEALFGTLIHATMKYIHDPAILSPTLEQALDYFSRQWNGEIWDNELEERAAFAEGITMIQKYYEHNDIQSVTVVDLESRFSLEIGTETDGKHIISGIIDRIDKTKEGYEIIDYKTARKMPSQEKVDNDLQLSIYLKAFLHRYPKEWNNLDHITVSLYFLKHGVKLSSKRTREQLEQLDCFALSVIRDIEAEKFSPILSPLCDWCGYQKICPLWKHKFKVTSELETDQMKTVIEEYLAVRDRLGNDKLRLAELQALILEYMQKEGVDRVFGSRGVIARSLRKTYKYDEAKLKEILAPLNRWQDVLKVDNTLLRHILPFLSYETQSAIERNAKIIDKESISLSVKRLNEIEETEH